ncbi:response regulator [Nostoc sp. C117]|uniref:response regulator n=1 Tax=Nostoc sp. C117 TaxID=3349875 RepID=UPI00370DBBD2
MGLDVQPVESSSMMLQAMQQNRFHLAIIDIDSPQFKNIHLIEQISTLPLQQNLTLVILTSQKKQNLEITPIATEFTAFLEKPLRHYQLHNTLLKIIRDICSKKSDVHSIKTIYSSRTAPPNIPVANSKLAQVLPLKILLVEDNLVNQKIALKLIERLGYKADVANNGVEAIKAIQQQFYDLVFMDVQMPEMDGLEATRHIRNKISLNRQPKIVAMTASARAEDRQECLNAGMDDYISKPIGFDAIEIVIKKCCNLDNDISKCNNTM